MIGRVYIVKNKIKSMGYVKRSLLDERTDFTRRFLARHGRQLAGQFDRCRVLSTPDLDATLF